MSGRSPVTIVALNALPAIDPERGNRIGGMETFAWGLARALAADGTAVSLIVRSPGRLPTETLDGVRLIPEIEPLRAWRWDVSRSVERVPGFPGIRIRSLSNGVWWKAPALAALRIVRKRPGLEQRLARLIQPPGSIVMTLGVSQDTAAALSASRTLGSPNILWFRSNADLDSRFLQSSDFQNAYGVTSADFRRCLELSDLLIAQTETQRSMLFKLTGRHCAVISNPVDADRFSPGRPQARRGVLWIGRCDRMHKRPLLALEIARRCPEIPFTMAINPGDDAVATEIAAITPPNVTIVDSIPHIEMADQFRKAAVFLSTGSPEHEGFPNVLLEAAACETPILSLEDFDGFLQRSSAGRVAGPDLEQAAIELRKLASDPELATACGKAGREYVLREHSMSSVLRSLQPLLNGLSLPETR